MAGTFGRKSPRVLINEGNKPILEKEQKQSVCVGYMQGLFKDERPDELAMPSLHDIGPLISKTDVILPL